MSEDFSVNCSLCKKFDDTRYIDYPGVKGYCRKKSMAIYSLKQKCCIDFAGVIPKIEVVIPRD